MGAPTSVDVTKLSAEMRARLISLSVPRIVEPYFRHIPHPKQQFFLSLRQREAMYGGAAGGGKSDALLMAALQYVDVPGYSALLLRRTWADLALPGAIMDRARTWLEDTPAHPREGGRFWVFPSGARITFGYLQHDKDKYRYASAEFQYIGFDELTQFEQTTYEFLFSRLRKPQLSCLMCGRPVAKYGSGYKHKSSSTNCPKLFPDPKTLEQYQPAKDGTSLWDVPLRMRSATNPGGIGHIWVRGKFVDPLTRSPKALFVPALLTDNPSLDQEEYEESLSHLGPIDRERLLNGDWDVTQEGALFQRHWFESTEMPTNVKQRVRYWDCAATADAGDWSVGIRLSMDENNRWVVEDVVRGQWSPAQLEKVILQTAMQDQMHDRRTVTMMEQEPGSAGVAVISHYQRNILVGFVFKGVRPTGAKETRAAPVASAAEAGNVVMVRAPWNKDYLDEMSLFPNGAHDDQVDATSGAFHEIAFGRRARLIV
jgi:predicted phage terminase large subunit-like protein